MAQVRNLRLQECTLGGLQLQSSCPEMVKDLPQTTDMSRKVWGDYNDIVQINEEGLPV